MSYRCTVCGELHDDLPDVGSDRPDGLVGHTSRGTLRRVELTADTCVIDDEDYYIRGVIEIPIHGRRIDSGSARGSPRSGRTFSST